MKTYSQHDIVTMGEQCKNLGDYFEINIRDCSWVNFGYRDFPGFLEHIGCFDVTHIEAEDIHDDVIRVTRCSDIVRTVQ